MVLRLSGDMLPEDAVSIDKVFRGACLNGS